MIRKTTEIVASGDADTQWRRIRKSAEPCAEHPAERGDCLLFYERGKLVPVYKKAGLDEHYQEIDVDSFIKMITSEKCFDYFMFYHSVREIVFG